METIPGRDDNFLGIDPQPGWPDEADTLILPVPFEQTSSYGRGSAAGPEAILSASQQVELYDTGLGFSPLERLGGICTLPALPSENCDGPRLAARLEQAVAFWLARGKRVVTLGGEHTSVVGAIHAHARHFPDLTVVQLDAHSDLRASYLLSPWNHACAMARVRDVTGNIVQVGIRSECDEEAELVGKDSIPVFYGEDIQTQDRIGKDWIGDIVAATTGNIYLTFDCDALDPSIMPATGTPEPAGLNWSQVDRLFRRLSVKRTIVGFDISELAPIETVHHPQFTVAKLIYRLLGYISLKNK